MTLMPPFASSSGSADQTSADGESPIRVLVVDDHPLMRIGVSAIIASQPDMEIVGQTGTGEDAIRLHAELQPDITLMDLRLPKMSGVAAIAAIRKVSPSARFLVLTTYEGDEDIFQALQAGAAGYLIKGMPHELLVQGLRRVHRGKHYLPTEVARVLDGRTPDAELSVREREVLALIAEGLSNKEIGARLGVTEATIKSHVGVILSRLQANDRTQAVMFGLQRGLIHL